MIKGKPVPQLQRAIGELEDYLHTYQQGSISAWELEMLLKRVVRRFERVCWCDEGCCCNFHHTHVEPHMRCILR